MKATRVFTILVGGPAGAGARSVGTNLGHLLNKSGYEVFVSVEYPSLIRGGHNLCRLSFSTAPVMTTYYDLDILVATDKKTVELHQPEIKTNGVIFSDSVDKSEGSRIINVPATVIAQKMNAPLIAQAVPLIGAVAYYLGLNLRNLSAVLREVFGDKAVMNIALAKAGYDYAKKNKIKTIKLPVAVRQINKKMVDGSTAIMEGMSRAGLRAFVAYPMTPATPMLHYAAKNHRRLKIKVAQMENEIAVANMALGLAYAGAPTAVGTSGGGFALMTEALSLAGMAEIPIVAIDAQRDGPATGVATRQAQGDLNFVTHTIGEYPRIVLAPGDMTEACSVGADALRLAWDYQTPVVVLTDKHLAESSMSCVLPIKAIKPLVLKASLAGGKDYRRYKITPSGVSPLAYPGMKDAVVKVNSYEHEEDGLTTEDPEWVKKMFDKRFAKLTAVKKVMGRYDTLRIYGDKKSKNVVLCWGSVVGAAREALKYTAKSFKIVQLIWLDPLDAPRLKKELRGARKVVAVENNYTAQMCRAISEQTGLLVEKKILRYDSSTFDPLVLARNLDKILK